ncbi:uncharacterized protein LOC131995053 isoform X2 [Stomoxys calcitrans]|uniref:uncharacterized protein LOC131995053 isoform X2 n=1 Tax=Stomoxys calcitrans TaxID=35570 RepID=UPI0027E3981E|nr:uncharacterized protein LOC131995053 isoform X2 [Stomoxys calcitrans]
MHLKYAFIKTITFVNKLKILENDATNRCLKQNTLSNQQGKSGRADYTIRYTEPIIINSGDRYNWEVYLYLNGNTDEYTRMAKSNKKVILSPMVNFKFSVHLLRV